MAAHMPCSLWVDLIGSWQFSPPVPHTSDWFGNGHVMQCGPMTCREKCVVPSGKFFSVLGCWALEEALGPEVLRKMLHKPTSCTMNLAEAAHFLASYTMSLGISLFEQSKHLLLMMIPGSRGGTWGLEPQGRIHQRRGSRATGLTS